jgi:hypothetical protein
VNVLSFVLLGDALRDAFDPRLRWIPTDPMIRRPDRDDPIERACAMTPLESLPGFDGAAPPLAVEDLHVEFATSHGVTRALLSAAPVPAPCCAAPGRRSSWRANLRARWTFSPAAPSIPGAGRPLRAARG